jgi:hypothetical protein
MAVVLGGGGGTACIACQIGLRAVVGDAGMVVRLGTIVTSAVLSPGISSCCWGF